jgi:hypothetical protein
LWEETLPDFALSFSGACSAHNLMWYIMPGIKEIGGDSLCLS